MKRGGIIHILYSIQIALFFLFIGFFASCDDTEVPMPEPIVKDTIDFSDCEYIENVEYLDAVSVFAINNVSKYAGYQQFSKYMHHSIEVYKIEYHTTFKGQDIIASGIISIPSTSTSQSFPIAIVGNGLIYADEDAPSAFQLPDNFCGFEFLASVGYITFIPDMIGFGSSKDLVFPVHNYQYSAQAMIDFYRAGEEFIQRKKILNNEKHFVVGYSMGGYIALAMLKEVENHPEYGIQFTAAAVGAGGFDLNHVISVAMNQETYAAPSHLVNLFTSYNSIYEWNHPLNYFFNSPYAERIPTLFNGQFHREEIDQYLSDTLDNLLNPDFKLRVKNQTETALIEAFEENNIGNWKPSTKLLIMHSDSDEIVPYSDSEQMYQNMINLGATEVSFMTIPGQPHFKSGLIFYEYIIQWFDQF